MTNERLNPTPEKDSSRSKKNHDCNDYIRIRITNRYHIKSCGFCNKVIHTIHLPVPDPR